MRNLQVGDVIVARESCQLGRLSEDYVEANFHYPKVGFTDRNEVPSLQPFINTLTGEGPFEFVVVAAGQVEIGGDHNGHAENAHGGIMQLLSKGREYNPETPKYRFIQNDLGDIEVVHKIKFETASGDYGTVVATVSGLQPTPL